MEVTIMQKGSIIVARAISQCVSQLNGDHTLASKSGGKKA